MGNNPSICRTLNTISKIGTLYAVPRSIINTAFGGGIEGASVPREFPDNIVVDNSAILRSAAVENPILSASIPDIKGPLLLTIFETITDECQPKIPTLVTNEKEKMMKQIASVLLLGAIDLRCEILVLAYNGGEDVKRNAEKVHNYVVYHSLTIQFTGKLNYSSYATNENMFLIFPHGLGLAKELWFNATWTIDGMGRAKMPIHSVLKVATYTHNIDYPTFQTTNGFYNFEGKFDVVNKTLEFTMYNPSRKELSDLKISMEHIANPSALF